MDSASDDPARDRVHHRHERATVRPMTRTEFDDALARLAPETGWTRDVDGVTFRSPPEQTNA